MTGPGAIVFGNTLPTTFTTVFPPRKTSSWPGHPTSRKRWPSWTEVSVESAEVETPMHKVFISHHHDIGRTLGKDKRHNARISD